MMKIQCDVCNKDEASVFCSADEAALCNGCDYRVHHANKLASKHHRFSLLHPSESPLCDVCQERKAFLFCREDRAILCRECDLSIHTANELTKQHNRFLLTGVQISSTSSIFSETSPSTTTTTTTTINSSSSSIVADSKKTMKKSRPLEISSLGCTTTPTFDQQNNNNFIPLKLGDYKDVDQVSLEGSTSSISEYLIEMLPGWQVEDLLDSSSVPTTNFNGFCKNGDLLPISDASNLDQINDMGCFHSDDLALWVPEIPLTPHNHNHNHPLGIEFHRKNGLVFNELKETAGINPKVKRKQSDQGFRVPQIRPLSNKRSKSIW